MTANPTPYSTALVCLAGYARNANLTAPRIAVGRIADYTGKTVLILVNDPGFGTGDPELFNGRSMTYYGRWTYKFEEAARQGATAALVIHETDAASYVWDVVTGSWSGAQSDLVRTDGGAERATMEGWITRDMAAEMFAKAGLDFEVMKADAKSRGFKPVPLTGVKARGRIQQTI